MCLNGVSMKEMKKPMMYKALPDHVKLELEPYNLLKTKGLYDVTDAYWLSTH